MKTSIVLAVCGLLILAGCDRDSSRITALTKAPVSCPNSTSTTTPPKPLCNVTVNITATPGQGNCVATVTDEIVFSGTNPAVSPDVAIVWTLMPQRMGSSTTFAFDSNGIVIVSDPNGQLSKPSMGNGISSVNWMFSTRNKQDKTGTMTYELNITEVDVEGVVTRKWPCKIVDPKIVNN